jgi:cell division septum initiation protein DivIVA
MTETLRRDEFIAILNRLGSDEDEEVLQAARQAHARIAASGMSWEDLLVPEEPAAENEEPAAEPAAESDEADDREREAVEDEPPAERAGAEGTEKDTESLALIGELLARSDISEELRAELEGYKTDIAENEFVEADRRYLRAIRKRLSK